MAVLLFREEAWLGDSYGGGRVDAEIAAHVSPQSFSLYGLV